MSLLTGLVSHWKMNEASGDALDAHGSHPLTNAGTSIGTGAGKIGAARDLDTGTLQYFTVADHADFSPGDTSFTCAVWVNLESFSSFACVLSKWNATNNSNREYGLFLDTGNSNQWAWQVNSTGAGPGTTRLATDAGSASTATWYLLVVMHDHTNDLIGISVNGSTYQTNAHTGGIFDGTTAFQIGAFETGPGNEFPFDGLIDSVSYWSRKLEESEITTLYNGGAGVDYESFGGGANDLSANLAEPVIGRSIF